MKNVRCLLNSISVLLVSTMLLLANSASAEALAVPPGRIPCGTTTCERCTQVCVGNPTGTDRYCAPSGYVRCEDGDCVRPETDPRATNSCKCSPSCNACTQVCGSNGNCNTRLPSRKVCQNQACVDSTSNCPDDCSPACDSCTEMCVTGTDGRKSCKSTDKKYCPGRTACVTDTAQCGDQCTPKCDNCTQSCTGGSCKDNGNKRCWTGACVGPGSDCPPDRAGLTPTVPASTKNSNSTQVTW